MQVPTSQPSSGPVLGRSVVFPITDEELSQEEEAPLIKKTRRLSISSPVEVLTITSQGGVGQRTETSLFNIEPIAGKSKTVFLSHKILDDSEVVSDIYLCSINNREERKEVKADFALR